MAQNLRIGAAYIRVSTDDQAEHGRTLHELDSLIAKGRLELHEVTPPSRSVSQTASVG